MSSEAPERAAPASPAASTSAASDDGPAGDPIARSVRAPAAPGPRGHLLFGSTPAFRRDPIRTLIDGWRAYGDVVHYRFGGPYHGYLLAHPDHVQRVLQEANRNYPKHPFYNGKLRAVVGDSVLTTEGETWRRQRRLIQPAFHRQRIAALGTLMTDATQAMLAEWAPRARSGEVVDVATEMMRLTLTIVARAMFSADVDADARSIGPAVTTALIHVQRRAGSYVDLPLWLPLRENRRFVAALGALDAIVDRLVAEPRRSGDQSVDDLLSMLLRARDESGEGMTDRQIRDEVLTIFLAGHETTAVTLTWAWYLLSTHPEIARRLRAELDAVLAGRTPTIDDLAKLEYNRAIVEETLRLYPAAWILTRLAQVEDEFGGYRIPARTTVFLSPYVTHRHPAFWPNPEGFDPDRFAAAPSATRPRFAYFPFGGGPRVCIGQQFALIEAQLILATVAQQFRLDLVPGYRAAYQPTVTLRARNGMPMRLALN